MQTTPALSQLTLTKSVITRFKKPAGLLGSPSTSIVTSSLANGHRAR